MARRKLPPASKKSVNRVTAPMIVQRALDEGEPPEPLPPDAPTAPMLATADEQLLAPDAIPACDPEAPAPPPGRAPAGDSRSLRRAPGLFALVYRWGSALVSRTGALGSAGHWRVVEYPTVAGAARAYAREVALLVDEGFVDVL